jgi:indole-3-glycerol phosphate synthase
VSNALAEIAEAKREHLAATKRARPLGTIESAAKAQTAPRGFLAALCAARAGNRRGLICEIKKASPSKGLIRADFDPPSLARAYAQGGATCMSVLTDMPFFQGRDEDLLAARAAVALPALRKDFMLEPYQVVEARALGADCILVILAMTDDAVSRELMAEAARWNMDVLVEVHDRAELDRAVALGAKLIGINNRNLKTLQVDLATSEQLAAHLPKDALGVCESGIFTPADLARMERVGLGCFLIGESLMRQADVAAATRALLEPVAA